MKIAGAGRNALRCMETPQRGQFDTETANLRLSEREMAQKKGPRYQGLWPISLMHSPIAPLRLLLGIAASMPVKAS